MKNYENDPIQEELTIMRLNSIEKNILDEQKKCIYGIISVILFFCTCLIVVWFYV